MNDIDRPNIVAEIDSVGRSGLRACESLLARAIEHMMKLPAWPGQPASPHWRSEARGLLRDARHAVSPSMRQHPALAALYAETRADIMVDEMDGAPPPPLPATSTPKLDVPFADLPDLHARLAALGRPD